MTAQQQKLVVSRLVSQEVTKMKLSVTRNMMSVMLLVLKDRFDFEAEHLAAFMKESFAQFELVNDKFVTIEDFYTELENLGLKVK